MKRRQLAVIGLGLFVGGAIINQSLDRTAGFFVALAGVALVVFGTVVSRSRDVSDSRRGDPELLTAEQIAEKLGVRPDWIYTLVARDSIPYVRQGGRW